MVRVRDITLVAILTTILFVQKQVLFGLTNIQLNVMLIILFTKTQGLRKTVLIVTVYTVLDSMLFGLSFIFLPFTLFGWLIIPFLITTIFRKVNSPMGLSILGILFSFLYSWVYIIPSIYYYQVSFIAYFLYDIPFAIIIAVSSFCSILWLYEPLAKVINNLEATNTDSNL